MRKILYIVCWFVMMVISSCDEQNLDIINYGSISGTVLDGDTYLPLKGVQITTTPPSISLLSDTAGKFSIPKIQTGEVAVNVTKKDYLSNSLSVAIYSGEPTLLNFLIFKDDNNIGNVTIYDPVPGNGAIDQLTGFLLQWKVDSKKLSTNFTYSIYIFESNSTVQNLVGEDISVPEVTVSGLSFSTTYFWYVIAKYEGNKVAFSPTWSFKTKAN
jgi:hypothetical protein